MTNIFYSRETTLGQNKVWNVKENTLEPLDQNGKPGIPYTFGKIDSLIHIHRCKYVLVHVYVFETLSRTFQCMINLIMNVSYTHLLVNFLDYNYIHLLTLGVLFFQTEYLMNI